LNIIEFCKKHKMGILFYVSYTFYLVLGLCLFGKYNIPRNLFFGTDNRRVFIDMVCISGDHSRLTVHPLFILLIQPITLTLGGIVRHVNTTVVLLMAFAGAVSNCCMYRILSRYLKKESLRLGFTAIYMFSFCVMLFSTISETFIISGMFLLLFWNYALYKIQSREELNYLDYFLLIFMGITNFGITITNYIPYVIGLFAIVMMCIKKNFSRLMCFLGINAVIISAAIVLSKLQRRSWRGNTPFFIDAYRCLDTSPESFGEAIFMNFDLTKYKLVTEFEQVVVHSFFGGEVFLEGNYFIGFQSGSKFYPALAIMITIAVFASVIWCTIKRVHVLEAWMLSIVYIFNVCMHYVYSSLESFIFTPHFFYLLIIILALGVSACNEQPIFHGVVWSMVGIEAVTNILTYKNLIPLVAAAVERPVKACEPTILATIVLTTAVAMAILVARKFLSSVGWITISPKMDYRAKAFVGIACYGLLILTVSFSVMRYTAM